MPVPLQSRENASRFCGGTADFCSLARAMGILDKATAPASPWQNGFAERLIGSIRRECLYHIIVLGEAHLRRVLRAYVRFKNDNQDAPIIG